MTLRKIINQGFKYKFFGFSLCIIFLTYGCASYTPQQKSYSVCAALAYTIAGGSDSSYDRSLYSNYGSFYVDLITDKPQEQEELKDMYINNAKKYSKEQYNNAMNSLLNRWHSNPEDALGKVSCSVYENENY
ncbi:TPA: hypothetical protein P0E24_001743 [Vibrio campbellii]|nr:hypothetical protein [Vibrio campbellii]HDM8242677.1 hypothetical protein [Vibrio campbellii]